RAAARTMVRSSGFRSARLARISHTSRSTYDRTTMTIDAARGAASDSASLPDSGGHFGRFGGRFAPEALMAALDELTREFEAAKADPAFTGELEKLLTAYAGRPSLLTEARRFAEHAGGARILLKREDLNHTGSHK